MSPIVRNKVGRKGWDSGTGELRGGVQRVPAQPSEKEVLSRSCRESAMGLVLEVPVRGRDQNQHCCRGDPDRKRQKEGYFCGGV